MNTKEKPKRLYYGSQSTITKEILKMNKLSIKARCSLAKNMHINADIQLILVGGRDESIRERIANNPAIHADAQAILAKDEDIDVRWSLAGIDISTLTFS